MTINVLLRGYIDFDGKVKSTPIVVTLNEQKEVVKYETLGIHEPHSTTFDSTHLLDLKTNLLV